MKKTLQTVSPVSGNEAKETPILNLKKYSKKASDVINIMQGVTIQTLERKCAVL